MKSINSLNGELGPGDDSNERQTSSTRMDSAGAATSKVRQNMLISICAISVGASLGALLRGYFATRLNAFSTFSAEVVTALLEGRSMWALSTIGTHAIGSIV